MEKDNFKRTVFHYCSLNLNGTEMFQNLISKYDKLKPMIDDRDNLNNSALIYAFISGNNRLLEYLLRNGAKVDTQFETRYLFLNHKIIPRILQNKYQITELLAKNIQDDTYKIQDFSIFETELGLTLT